MKTFACVALLVIAAAGSAGAQALQRLTVRDFSLSADAAQVAVGGTLRVTVRVHVDQAVGELDNVTLPNLSGFDILGDERQCVTAARGTDCSETLTMSPNAAGTYTIGPVALDSIDPRTNRATHFATNVVSVTVTGNAGGGPVAVPSLLYDVMRQILILAIAAIIVLVLIWGIGLPRRKRPAPTYLLVPPAPAPRRRRPRIRTRRCARRSPRSRASRRGRASSRCAICCAPVRALDPTRRSRR